MSRLIKGSPDALAWAKKMKKARIRAAGRRTEHTFFGPGGHFEDEAVAKARKNPSTTYQVWSRTSGKMKRVAVFPSLQYVRKWFDLQTEHSTIEVWKDDPIEPEPYFIGKLSKNPGRPHGKFRSCVKQVTATPLPPGSDPKKICGAALAKKNPITIVGNPNGKIPATVNAAVAGVLYTLCHEIRAEKTQSGKDNGFYYHPFARSSKVCILALDNGDLLIHSQAGAQLWREL